MYSLYIVWYIFLAGMGGGAYTVASVFSLARRFSKKRQFQEYRHLADNGFILGLILVASGAVFLLFDLGSPEKAYLALISLRFSILSIGAWLIVLFCLSATASLLNHYHPLISFPSIVEICLQILTLIFAIGLVTYTGVYIAAMPSMPFHNHWLLVVLFVLSSLSTGSAVIAIFGFLNQHRKAMLYSLRLIPKIDMVLIVMEILTLGAFICISYFGDERVTYSLQILMFGERGLFFWLGVVITGLVLPLLCAFLSLRNPQGNLAALSSLFIIVGGFFLRYCLISAGIHISQFIPLQG